MNQLFRFTTCKQVNRVTEMNQSSQRTVFYQQKSAKKKRKEKEKKDLWWLVQWSNCSPRTTPSGVCNTAAAAEVAVVHPQLYIWIPFCTYHFLFLSVLYLKLKGLENFSRGELLNCFFYGEEWENWKTEHVNFRGSLRHAPLAGGRWRSEIETAAISSIGASFSERVGGFVPAEKPANVYARLYHCKWERQ